jgi:hypothetical protein
MECKWIRYYGEFYFKSDCGCIQGLDVRPKQKICFCKNRIKRLIQQSDGSLKDVTRVVTKKGHSYYFTD